MNRNLKRKINDFEGSKIYFFLRKFNTVISIILVFLVLFHGLIGSIILFQISYIDIKWISWLSFYLLLIHTVLGIIFTTQSIKLDKSKWYLKQNLGFWIRRISGLLMLILVFFHYSAFGGVVNGQYMLFEFNTLSLTIQILLIISLFVHIVSNIRPMFDSLGIIRNKSENKNIILILSIFIIIFTIASIFYFISWQIGWIG
ncbi:hypothetical protein LJB96_01620 [Methanobrevibacter sp. OttesenSCG-928-K11]|nr:hypothetical protein [Methanobrevibacter sp. OttesenSCG-928-K11]MDL2270596.1 hypothetical protein [Methanobrevibacter sp. OttesenSCG-928-I08]